MDSENRFWIVSITIICATIISICAITGLYWTNHNKQIADLILNEGLNPLEVRCALEDSHGSQKTCIVLAAKQLSR